MKTLLGIGLVVTATAVLAGVLAMASSNVAFANTQSSFGFGGGQGGQGGNGQANCAFAFTNTCNGFGGSQQSGGVTIH
jgi:hypothetical protein